MQSQARRCSFRTIVFLSRMRQGDPRFEPIRTRNPVNRVAFESAIPVFVGYETVGLEILDFAVLGSFHDGSNGAVDLYRDISLAPSVRAQCA